MPLAAIAVVVVSTVVMQSQRSDDAMQMSRALSTRTSAGGGACSLRMFAMTTMVRLALELKGHRALSGQPSLVIIIATN